MQDDDDGAEDDEVDEDGGRVNAPQPNSLQRKMLEMAGQDLDQFMKVISVKLSYFSAQLGQNLVRTFLKSGRYSHKKLHSFWYVILQKLAPNGW